jgi:hypothetical protein
MLTALLVLNLLSSCAVPAQGDVDFRIVEEGGAGSWKSVVVEDAALPGVRLYTPKDLPAAVAKTTLPVVLFEGRDKDPYDKYLNEIASYGYVVVNTAGKDPDAVLKALQTTQGVFPGSRADLVDWERVGVISMVGGRTLLPASSETLIYLHSSGPRYAGPYLFLTGGEDGGVLQSVYDTFFAEDKFFVAAATYPAGAEGTFADPFGGSYAMLTLQWLEWTLKDKAWTRTVFTGEECICYFKGWGVQQRNENTVID